MLPWQDALHEGPVPALAMRHPIKKWAAFGALIAAFVHHQVITADNAADVKALAERYDDVDCSVGVHPLDELLELHPLDAPLASALFLESDRMGYLLGAITDGDLRRHIEQGLDHSAAPLGAGVLSSIALRERWTIRSAREIFVSSDLEPLKSCRICSSLALTSLMTCTELASGC